jgi:hypothetical protein
MEHKCPRCGSPTRMLVSVEVDIPLTMAHRLSKKNLYSNDAKVMGVIWDQAAWYCPNGDWNYSLSMNVFRQKDLEIASLKAKIKELEDGQQA